MTLVSEGITFIVTYGKLVLVNSCLVNEKMETVPILSLSLSKGAEQLSGTYLASSPGPQGRKEGLVHTVCACAKVYQKSWYIVYFRKILRKPLKCTYVISLNQRRDRHRLPPSPRTDPLDISLVGLSFKGQTKAKHSSDRDAGGQRSNPPRV